MSLRGRAFQCPVAVSVPIQPLLLLHLSEPPIRTHMMLSSKPAWVTVAVADGDKSFDAYPDESLAEWHLRLGLEDGGN